MSGTQAPKAFGFLFLFVGIPYIVWDASATGARIKELDSTDSRQAQCVAKSAKLSIPRDEAEPMCRCIIREAKERGILAEHGGYDPSKLGPVLEQCVEANVSLN